jgi:hypothetical protein
MFYGKERNPGDKSSENHQKRGGYHLYTTVSLITENAKQVGCGEISGSGLIS